MWPRCVCGLSLRPAMSSIIRRRSGLTVLVSLMESSFLSEVHDTSILRTGALHRYHYLLTWLPISRLLLPRSGLERSDFVRWPIASFRGDAKVDRYRGIADHARTCRWPQPVANDPKRALGCQRGRSSVVLVGNQIRTYS